MQKTKSHYYYIVHTDNKKAIEKLNSTFRKFPEDKRPVLITTPHTSENKIIKINKFNFKREEIENYTDYDFREAKTKNIDI